MEQQKSPVTASSHDKNTHPPEVSSPNDPVKNEPPPSPSKASELNSHAKTSAVGGSRKDQNTAKEGFSVSGGSRNKRRGTVDNVEADGKLTNAMNTKTKGTKEKEKSNKSSGKSAKKVIIDDCKEKNVTSNASGKGSFAVVSLYLRYFSTIKINHLFYILPHYQQFMHFPDIVNNIIIHS